MAFDFFAEDQSKNNDPGQGTQLGQQSPIITGGQQTAQQPGGTTSGSFTNLQSYLDANKDQNFGQQVAGRVQNKIDSANQQQGEAEKSFSNLSDQSSAKADQDLIGRVGTDPGSITSDKDKFDQFTKMRDAQYAGPKNFSDDEQDYSNTYQGTQNAAKTAELSKDEGGRKAILDDEYGQGRGRYDYTPGQKKLDNYLIQNDQGSKDAFGKVQQSGQNLSQNFKSLSDRLDQYAQQNKEQTEQARSRSRNALGIDDSGNETGSGAIGGLKGNVQNTLQSRLQEQKTQDAQARKAFQDRDLGELNGLGNIDLGDSNSPLYNQDPSKFLSGPADVNEQTVASPDQYARMAALSQLSGRDNTYLPNSSLAGKYTSGPLVNFNTQGWQQILGQQKSGLDTDVSNIQTTANRIKSQKDQFQQALDSGPNMPNKDSMPSYMFGIAPPPGYDPETPISQIIGNLDGQYNQTLGQIAPLQQSRGANDKWRGSR